MSDNLKALDQESLHFYSALQKLFDCEQFLSHGGLVGFTCAHAYPHTSQSSMDDLHHMLKGIDMVVYQALKRLLGSAYVTAVLDDMKYLRDRSERGYSDDEEANYDCVSASLRPVLTFPDGNQDEAAPDPSTAFPRQGVTWLNHAPNSRTATEFAVAFRTYGNQPGIGAYYSSAVILAKADAFGGDMSSLDLEASC
ncbi:hypothetical protein CEP53_012677 [Fusarium sp. AF-6]|nr:hypothetical protein CEP53_012677 [Fusarium sp. AF-6]